jgi:hypothetical protein
MIYDSGLQKKIILISLEIRMHLFLTGFFVTKSSANILLNGVEFLTKGIHLEPFKIVK